MNNKYHYCFDKEKCWYKNVCSYHTEEDGFNDVCNPSCERFMEMDYLTYMSRIPTNKQYPKPLTPEKCDYKSFERLNDIKNDIENFVDDGYNLYLYSERSGNGKTSWAIKLMLSYFDKKWCGNGFTGLGVFVSVPTFLRKVTESVKNYDEEFIELKALLLDIDLVIWDDIGSTKLSDFDHKYLLSFIDDRSLKGLSNIYTGNLSGDRLCGAVGNRLYSRIFNDSVQIELKGQDRRGL